MLTWAVMFPWGLRRALALRAALYMLLVIATTLVTACQTSSLPSGERTQGAGATEEGLQRESGTVEYVLQTGDELEVKFFYNKELDQTVIVRRDGMISLQLVGDIKATGSTPEEFEKRVRESYQSVLRRPEVTVIIKSFSPRLFYIWGQVNKPGSYPHEIGMTVQQAVATAGGFTPRARTSQFRLVRADDAGQSPKDVGKNMLVMPGDTIEVLERYF